MDTIDFSSDFHPLGNYLFKFLRKEIEFNIFLNIIEIYTFDKIKITDIKLSTESCIYLYNRMYLFTMYTDANFEYEIPVYNTFETTKISGLYTVKNICNQEEICALLKIEKRDINNKYFELSIISTFYDFEKFIFAFHFLLLADVIDYG